MKRIFTFLILTLTLIGSFFCPLSSAHAEIVYANNFYYTISDLLEIGQEVEAAKIAVCGEDYDYWCGEDVFFDQFFLVDAKYRAYDIFQHGSLSITAIDPYTDTARIFYRDKDDMPWGDNRSYELKEFYLYWLDPSVDTDWTDVLDTYIDEIKAGTYDPEMVHVLFSGNQASDFEWLTPNEESILELNSEAGYSTTQTVHFHAISNGASYGQFNLQECLGSPNHEVGMECAKVYGEEDTPLISMVPQLNESEGYGYEEGSAQDEDDNQNDPDQPTDPEQGDLNPESNEESELSEPEELAEPIVDSEQPSEDQPAEIQPAGETKFVAEDLPEQISQSESEPQPETCSEEIPEQTSQSGSVESGLVEPEQPTSEIEQSVVQAGKPKTTKEPINIIAKTSPGSNVAAANLESSKAEAQSTSVESILLPSSNRELGPVATEDCDVSEKTDFLWWIFVIMTVATAGALWLIVPKSKKR